MSPYMRRNHGFTLIEVLIGATLFAVMMAIVTSAFFSMTRSARIGESNLDARDAERLVRALLRRELGEAFPLTERHDNDVERVLFDGRRDSVRFVGHLPAHRGGGGLQFVEVRVDKTAREALVLYDRPAWSDTVFETRIDGAWDRQVLALDIRTIRFRYFGASTDSAPAEWSDEWHDHDRLPELVRLDVRDAKGSWPPIAAEVRTRRAVGQQALFRLPPAAHP